MTVLTEPLDVSYVLRPEVYQGCAPDGQLYLLGRHTGQTVGPDRPVTRALLRLLADTGGTATQLAARLRRRGDSGQRLPHGSIEGFLRFLGARGWLQMTVLAHGRPAYTLEPLTAPPGPPPDGPCPDLTLSRFAVLRRVDDRLLIESSRSWCDITLHQPGMLTVIDRLVPPAASDGRGPEPAAVARLRRDLWWAGLAVVDPAEEERELHVRQWSVHDLWFHRRSRARRERPDRDGRWYGRTWWGRGRFPAPPARHPSFPSRTALTLPRPDLAALRRTDPPFAAVLEDRHSVRRYDDTAPLTIAQVGELLYRCARDRWKATDGEMEYLSRPYPSGGSAYELELYPVVRLVDGLEPGMYHYDASSHELARVSGMSPAVRRLLATAATTSAGGTPPQVLLIVAARFDRLMWKYEAMPYALILKHVGVLYQTMYLAATAMGIGPCGLGGGDPDAFAEATGLDPLREASVGEFMLGSRPAENDPEGWS